MSSEEREQRQVVEPDDRFHPVHGLMKIGDDGQREGDGQPAVALPNPM